MTTQMLANGATIVSFEPSGDRALARGQNFIIEWAGREGLPLTASSDSELIVLLADGAARLSGPGAEALMLEGSLVAIVPAGDMTLTLLSGGPAIILATDRTDIDHQQIDGNEAQDGRIAPVRTPFSRHRPLDRPLVTRFDALPDPAANPRIRFVQSATMSINIVRYDGPRGTGALSPHAHDDIEQGTLAIAGRYVHHLRTPWGKDMAGWRDDAHVEAGPGTMLLIPPELIHTTQGVGEEPHLLIDIFAPPRRDFIAKGWIGNAADYHDPDGAPT